MGFTLLNGICVSIVLIYVIRFVQSWNLTILHTNDIHSQFDEFDVNVRTCSDELEAGGKCFGGFPRQVTKAKEIRSSRENVLYLNGGDFYQGTIWYTIHRWKIVAELVNTLGIDVMSLGNHEFDDGLEGLYPLLQRLKPKVVVCNANASKYLEFEKFVKPSTIVEVGGEKIGIIGYLTTEANTFSKTGDVEIGDEVECIKREAHRLSTEEGLTKIFAVGHSGFAIDQRIAREVPEIDIVVGGHTNTFLYTGQPPSIEVPKGPYPVVIERADGSKALVVQDYAFGKYMGFLEVEFDEEGRVHKWSGNPILLDSSVKEDPDILNLLVPYREEVKLRARQTIGHTNVLLQGDRIYCHMSECNLGNVLADAVVSHFIEQPTEEGWNFISVALWHTYGIRGSIDEQKNGGNITFEDIVTAVSAFESTIDVVAVKGRNLRKILEHSMRNYDFNDFSTSRSFLQVSGLRLKYNVSKPVGSRLVEAYVRCADCRIPKFEPLNNKKLYWIATNAHMVKGGDKFPIKWKKRLPRERTSVEDLDVIQNYIKKHSPITTGLEDRITIVSRNDKPIYSFPLESDVLKLSIGNTFNSTSDSVEKESIDDSINTLTAVMMLETLETSKSPLDLAVKRIESTVNKIALDGRGVSSVPVIGLIESRRDHDRKR